RARGSAPRTRSAGAGATMGSSRCSAGPTCPGWGSPSGSTASPWRPRHRWRPRPGRRRSSCPSSPGPSRRPCLGPRGWPARDGCGALRPGDVGREVTLCGWVHARRDHGGVLFVDLRDRTGVVQVVCNPAESPAAHERARDVRLEFVIAVRGTVRPRPGETVNPDLPTGAVEVVASALHVLNTARPTPFPIDDAAEVTESTRLRYRYLDLRRPAVQRNLVLRHEVPHAVRAHLP